MTKLILFLILSVFSSTSAYSTHEFCHPDLCVTKFGIELGHANNVPAYSNCRSECVSSKSHKLNKNMLDSSEDHYTGMSWQCVEYARRYWILNFGIQFGDVKTANEIYSKMPAVTKISNNTEVIINKYFNGSKTPPKVGDLLVYEQKKDIVALQYGHVAIVVNVNKENGYIDVAEQNYDNKRWPQNTNYSRRISMVYNKRNQEYLVYNEEWKSKTNLSYNKFKSDLILGWVSPF